MNICPSVKHISPQAPPRSCSWAVCSLILQLQLVMEFLPEPLESGEGTRDQWVRFALTCEKGYLMSWDGAPTRSGLAPIIAVEGEEATSSSLPSPGIQPAISPHPSPPPLETFLIGTQGHSSSANAEKPESGAVRSLFSTALGALEGSIGYLGILKYITDLPCRR